MALTPEEVINKRFQATKFKEGYNPEEVDDFLDEIVIELRRLNAENSSLKRQLEEAEARASEVPTSAPATTATAVVSTTETSATSTQGAETEPVPAAETSSAASLLAMAQKVHDDYVLEGQREKERLLAKTRNEADSLLASAQEERSKVLGDLDSTKNQLQNSINQLRGFEKNYRDKLRKYLEDQLTEFKSETPVIDKIEGEGKRVAAEPWLS